MYYSRMGAGAPGNFEGMQRATTGADMVGLNFNTGGQYKGSNPQVAFGQFGSIEDVLKGRTNYGVLDADPYSRPQPQRNTMVPGMNMAADPFIKGPRPANSIIKAPDLDSPYMDEQLRRNFQPMRPPSAGPQLFPIRRVEGPGMQVAQGLPYENGIPMQGPTFPATPVQNYPGMGYGPVGPAGGGLPPDPYPARASGFNNKFVS